MVQALNRAARLFGVESLVMLYTSVPKFCMAGCAWCANGEKWEHPTFLLPPPVTDDAVIIVITNDVTTTTTTIIRRYRQT